MSPLVLSITINRRLAQAISNSGLKRSYGLQSAIFFLAIALTILSAASLQAATYSLGTTSLLEGPAAGLDSVVLAVTPSTTSWTAAPNAPWLHLTVQNQSGTGSANVIFSYDANPGSTRTGTLTIAGQTLTVTQAGSTYIAAPGPVTVLANASQTPTGIAVNSAGDVYFCSPYIAQVQKWVRTNNIVTAAFSCDQSMNVALDSADNIYVVRGFNPPRTIVKISSADNMITPLLSSGLVYAWGLEIDPTGNLYIANNGAGKILKWTAVNDTVAPIISSGVADPYGLALDVAGNLYISATDNNVVKKWVQADNTLTTVIADGLISPREMAVDGSGNLYIADIGDRTIKKWTAASNTVTTVSSGLLPLSVAVDPVGSVYFNDTSSRNIMELPRAFVDPTPKSVASAAGIDVLPVVLPSTANLLPPFAPKSDKSWLTITGITNGVVSFAFTATTSNRTANITLLGKKIPITQLASITPPTLNSPTLPANGSFQFTFTNSQSSSFTVVTSTNLSLPLTDWTVIGAPTNTAPGQFQFTTATTNGFQRFYRVRSP